MPSTPSPIAFPVGKNFLGADGNWSTIPIGIGTPPQTVQLLVSTQQPASWAVAPGGCGGDGSTANCTTARGGIYNPSNSSTWFRKDIYQLNEATNLGYGGDQNNGTYGFDKMSFTTAGGTQESVDHQVIANIATNTFYLGSIGLAPQVVNFSDSGDNSPSFITSLKNQNLIPSLSYGYTAGASYRSTGGSASLVIGGYDSAKLQKNDLQFQFANSQMRSLSNGLQSITYKDANGEKPLLSEGIITAVDSTVPYIWLPSDSCDLFANTLGLTWDPIKNLYMVNDSSHDALVKANPTYTFAIANTNTQGGVVNITFPFAAFDLNITAPLIKNTSRYFPLQRAPDGQSATLGRAFLQEAYLITNYETSTFSLSQAVHDNSPSNIVTIQPNTNGSTSTSPSGNGGSSKKSGGISGGAIAGLAIAIAAVGIIVAIIVFVLWRRRRKAKRNADLVHGASIPPPVDTKTEMTTTRNSQDDPELKKYATNVHVSPTEDPLTPAFGEMQGSNGYGHAGPSNPAPVELAAHRMSGIEMDSADGLTRPELPSPGLGALRSELSTPEPVLPQHELPTPDPSTELPSPPLRPVSPRSDSGSLGPEAMAGLGLHQRNGSEEIGDNRPKSFRRETEDSIESPILGHYPSGGSSPSINLETPTTPVGASTASAPRNLGNVNKRPVHLRQDSDTWQTRLAGPSTDDIKRESRFSTTDKKDGHSSEAAGLLSSTSQAGAPAADGQVSRKPVPSRTTSDEKAGPLLEENEDNERNAGTSAGGKKGGKTA